MGAVLVVAALAFGASTASARIPDPDLPQAPGGSGFPGAPSIVSFSPTSGGPGQVVALLGSNLSRTVSVAFNGVRASFTIAGDTAVDAVVPNQASTGRITVRTLGGSARTGSNFVVVRKPTVGSFSPGHGNSGTSVTVTGSGFTGATTVAFDGTAATFKLKGDNRLVATVPSGASSGPISVVTPAGSAASSSSFSVNGGPAPPVVNSFSPGSGPVGTLVTVSGSGFTGATAVTFDGKSSASFSIAGDTQLTATVPAGASSGPIGVTTAAGTGTSSTAFVVTAPPVVSGFSPGSGPTGTVVTVSGSGFTGATAVTFDGTSASFSVAGDSQLTATVPAAAASGPIAVTTPAGTGTSSGTFTVTGGGGGGGGTHYVAANGSDANQCTQASPCLTFDRAYRVSSPGDTVFVESGTYPGQTIDHDGSKSGSCDGYTIGASLDGCVTFQPASGAQISFTGGLQVFGDDVRLDGFTVSGVTVGDCNASNATTNVVLQSLTGINLIIGNASYVGDLDGNWGPLHGNQIVYVNDCAYTGASKPATHVRFDGGFYHDAIQDSGDQHLECLHIEPGDYITIRNSRFVDCAQHDVAIGGGVGTHYLIENNTLAAPCSGQGSPCGADDPIDASCSGTKSDWTVRFNSMDGAMIVSVNTGCTYGGSNLFYGNVETAAWFSQWQCDTFDNYGWQRSYDVGGGVACGTGSVVGPALVAPGAPLYNFHLLAASPAIGLVPAGVDRPTTDIAGNPRGSGVTDAGAYLHTS